jgi:hypothetical protein
LAVIVVGWIGARGATWDMSVWGRAGTAFGEAPGVTAPLPALAPVRRLAPPHVGSSMATALPGALRSTPVLPAQPALSAAHGGPLAKQLASVPLSTIPLPAIPPPTMAESAHELMLMAAVANLPLVFPVKGSGADPQAPASLTPPRAAPMLEAPSARAHGPVLPRWSGDAWLLARQGGGSAPGGALLLPSYGANQLGAVLRYRLAPASAFRPEVYGRAYGALNGTGEREAALGLAARPMPALPLSAMGELRVSRFVGGRTHLRPAVTLVTQLPPVTLPLALRAETYVQGGYVGGLAATPFVDGQFRLEHIAEHHGRGELRLGGGIWGGAQQGAGRLDVGPGATVAFATGRAGAHLSLDWRFRVAGHAVPGSGPALTLAAGF